jgi:hypothetical protein
MGGWIRYLLATDRRHISGSREGLLLRRGRGHPIVFPLQRLHAALAVCSIPKIWIFAAPATADSVVVLPYWEHEELAVWEVCHPFTPMSDDEGFVRRVAQLGDEHQLMIRWEPFQSMDHQSSTPYLGRMVE